MIQIIHIGLGPIGQKVIEVSKSYSHINSASYHDISVDLIGSEINKKKIQSLDDIQTNSHDQGVAIVTTSSSLEKNFSLFTKLIELKWNIVSSCEELSFSNQTSPDLTEKLNILAKAHAVKVLGTGINPGFLMDLLPSTLCMLNHHIESIHIERIQDASSRRIPFQRKIGAGLTQEEFNQKVQDQSLRHVGLRESHDFLEHYLGFKIEKREENIQPIYNGENISGVEQNYRGYINNQVKIDLNFKASVGEKDPRDRILIKGTPGLDMVIKGAVQGDEGTIAVLLNSIPSLLESSPGVKNMGELHLSPRS